MSEQSSNPDSNTTIEKKFKKVITPFQAFIADQTTTSLILIVCVVAALSIANSPLQSAYQHILHLPVGFYIDDHLFGMSLSHWINEGLMTFFFFLIGMEIKREVLVGEINQPKLLVPVLAAAVGGMLAPALIYYAFNSDNQYTLGWGIPMATDTAFAVGILALLGKRIPTSAFTFLTALAIIDDLGAVVVIGVFYSESLNVDYLLLSAALLTALYLLNLLGIRRSPVYLLGGILVWLAMLESGLHATIAGVLVATTIPAKPEKTPHWFSQKTGELIRRFRFFEKHRSNENPILGESDQHEVVEKIKNAAEKSTTPLRRWEKGLEHPVSLFILPVFALANAGIHIDPAGFSALGDNPQVAGITAGLVIGKGLGVPLLVWMVLSMGWGQLPEGLNPRHIIGIGLLGGMGFTMSIFIANLAFENAAEALLTAKIAILLASFLAGVLGYLWLRFAVKSAN